MAEDLKKRFNSNVLSHFHAIDFAKRLKRKRESGQLVRFTDVFGMAIGDALLPVGGTKNVIDNYFFKNDIFKNFSFSILTLQLKVFIKESFTSNTR